LFAALHSPAVAAAVVVAPVACKTRYPQKLRYVMTACVQVFGCRLDEAIHALRRPASEKRPAFRARKDDANERSAERHTRTSLICIRREQALRQFLVARSVGIVSAALRSVSSVRSGTDGSSTDAYRHSTAYRCATVNTAAISAAVIDASAANTSAPTAICERIS